MIKLASNESPWGPHPAVLEAVASAAAGANRYPDQYASLLRRRIADRFDLEPGGIAVSNGSCEILLAAALALCEPGAELVYAWPSFSMYPQLAPLSGAREIRVPLNDDYEHDLDAMAAEITVATQLVIVCNPNNPTGTCLPPERIAAFLERVPEHVTVILDEAYVEMQTLDDPDATVDLLRDFPNLVLLRTFSKVYGLAGLRCGYALGSAHFRAAVDAVRQPFSVNLLSQAAGAEAILHSDDVARPGRADRDRADRGRGGAARPRPANGRDPDQLLLDRPRARPRRGGDRRGPRPRRRDRPPRARRSAAPATSASPTAPRPRTNASLRRSPTSSDTTSAMSGMPISFHARPRGRPLACLSLVSAIYLGVRPGRLACRFTL